MNKEGTYVEGGTCLVRQPRLCDGGSLGIQETIFLGRVIEVRDDGESVDAVTCLGVIPNDDEATITGDGTRVRLLPQYGLEFYPDTPTNRRLLRALQAKENEAAKLEAALLTVAGVSPEKLTRPIHAILQETGRYR